MAAYYNEIDKYCAQWLRNLIAAGLIADGDVDERSIEDVRPDDLRGYAQCHFFAGLGGWSYALRLAGWPDDRSVWTCSCPCQPFSATGKELGFADERHLWPAQFHLIKERKPPKIFGEQVENAIKHGWLDLVRDDLEGESYAFGAIGLPAACVSAAHIRPRLWFVADANTKRFPQRYEHGIAQIPPGELQAWRELERVHAADAWEAWQAESSIPVFADGIPCRVGRTSAYGNSIFPHAAAEFIRAAA